MSGGRLGVALVAGLAATGAGAERGAAAGWAVTTGEAMGAEEFGRAVHELATAVAVVEFFGGFAGAAARAAGGG